MLYKIKIKITRAETDKENKMINKIAPAVDTVAPAVDTVAPAVDTVAPAVDTVAPAVDTVAPAVDTVAPAVDTVAPAVDTVAPAINVKAALANDIIETVDTLVTSTEIYDDVIENKEEEIATDAATVMSVKAKKVMVVPEMMQTEANLSHNALREVVSQHKNAGRVLYHSNNNASHGNFNKGKSPKLQAAYLEAAAATIGYTVVTALVKNEDIGQVEEFLKTSNANAMIEMSNICEADANKASIAKAEKEAEKAKVKAEKAEAKKLADEEKAKVKAEKAEAKKLADEEKAKVKAEKAEAKKLADEEKAKVKAEKAEAKKLADEEKAKVKAEKAKAKAKEAEQVVETPANTSTSNTAPIIDIDALVAE